MAESQGAECGFAPRAVTARCIRRRDLTIQIIYRPTGQDIERKSMTNDLIARSLRKFMIASTAIAGLGSALVLSTPEPAEAKRMTCAQKYRACNSRCAARSPDQNWQNCIYRTCNPQYDNCVGG
jgi:hypothetical protein